MVSLTQFTRIPAFGIHQNEIHCLLAAHTVTVNKGVWLDFIGDNIDRAAKRLFGMVWSFLAAPSGCAYITNDVGDRVAGLERTYR